MKHHTEYYPLLLHISELVNLPIYILPNFQLLDNDTSTGILSLALKINVRQHRYLRCACFSALLPVREQRDQALYEVESRLPCLPGSERHRDCRPSRYFGQARR
jgi:hypothetical protein